MTDDEELADALNGLSKTEIVESLTEIASEMVKDGEATSIEAGRADLWELPGVYEAFRKGGDTPPPPFGQAALAKADEQLVKDAAYAVVMKRASQIRLLPGNYSRSEAEIAFDDLWQTREGRELYSLATGPLGMLPISVARQKIEKSAAWKECADALAILDEWSK